MYKGIKYLQKLAYLANEYNGDEVEYINVYMTEKGKTVLITKVNDFAY